MERSAKARFVVVFVAGLTACIVLAQDTDSSSCGKGSFYDGERCRRCPINTFSDTRDARECTPCPPLQQSAEGSTSKSRCSSCSPGYFFDETARFKSCRPCPPDTFSTTGATTECTRCPPGMVSTSKSESCVKCRLGTFAAPLRSRKRYRPCLHCPPGQTTTTTDAKSCKKCLPGTYQPRHRHQRRPDGQCKPCPPGSFTSFAGKEKCAKCPRGSYQDLPGQSSCKSCPFDSTSSKRGAKHCRPTCDETQPGCISCLPGFGYNLQKNKCEECPPGTISAARSSTPCYPCPVGQGSRNAARTKCVCKPGYRLRKDGECEKCASGRANEDGGRCMCIVGGAITKTCQCPPFTRNVNNRCERCNPEKISGCRSCQSGYVFNRKMGRCEQCPANTFAEYSSTSCKRCRGDSRSMPGSSYCKCPRGQGLIENKCTPCPKGTRGSNDRCLPCSSGSFSDVVGATTCQDCPFDLEPPKRGATSCLAPCPPNSERQYGRSECRCFRSFFPVGEGDDLECRACGPNEELIQGKCQCVSGVFGGTDNKVCQPCGDRFSREGRKCVCIGIIGAQGKCERCPPGTQFYEEKCQKCPPGEVAPRPGSEYCRSCSPMETNIDQTKCLPRCPANSFRNLEEKCRSCKTGEKRVGRTCEACGNSSVSRGGDVPFCTRCTGGKVPNSQRNKCV